MSSAAPAVAIQAKRLGFAYRPDHWILRDCTLSVRRGRVVAVLGPNGRGKTTLLRLLAGVLSPREGSVEVAGPVAFLPQMLQVPLAYSVLDMVLMGRARHVGLFAVPSKADEAVAWQALDRVGMAPLAARSFDRISGGERQLVMFARALATEAQILILDEPGAGLDLQNQGLMLRWIKRLAAEGLTVVFTTHHPQHADAVADEVVLMLHAATVVSGDLASTLTEDNLSELFGVNLRRVQMNERGRAVNGIIADWQL